MKTHGSRLPKLRIDPARLIKDRALLEFIAVEAAAEHRTVPAQMRFMLEDFYRRARQSREENANGK